MTTESFTSEEIAYIYAICTIKNHSAFHNRLVDNGVVVYDKVLRKYYPVDENLKRLFEEQENTVFDFSDIAEEIYNLYPSGIKPGTSSSWKGTVQEVKSRLERLYKLTDKKLDVEKIVDATRMYVDMFSDDRTYMRTLFYFILHDKIENGTITTRSDLMDMIEHIKNPQQVKMPERLDWTSKVI